MYLRSLHYVRGPGTLIYGSAPANYRDFFDSEGNPKKAFVDRLESSYRGQVRRLEQGSLAIWTGEERTEVMGMPPTLHGTPHNMAERLILQIDYDLVDDDKDACRTQTGESR